MSKFDSLLDTQSETTLTAEEWRKEAQYWRTKAARAHCAYSSAYWDYELDKDMEGHCLFMAEILEKEQADVAVVS